MRAFFIPLLGLLAACAAETQTSSFAPGIDTRAAPGRDTSIRIPAPAPFAVPAAGTRMFWMGEHDESTGEAEIVGQEGLAALWLWQGQPIARYGLFPFSADGGDDMEEALASFWPLRVGNRVSYERVDGDTPFWRDSLEVVGYETVEVPAGRFSTYVVQYITETRNGEWSGALTSWYSPDLKWPVKNVFTTTDGLRRSQVLAAITPPA